MNTIHFLIDTGRLRPHNHTMIERSNNDTAALVAEICEAVAVPWSERIHNAAGCSPARGEADRFRNIRGFILHDTIHKILAGIAGECGRDFMIGSLDTFMKLQSLEATGPEDAVDFLLMLKTLVEEHAAGRDGAGKEAVRVIDAALDEWISVAKELYHEYRALIPRLKSRERRRTEIRVLNENKSVEAGQ
ncbi:MAG: hypothetical protein KA369_10415 [Spirochaetes bacterium]|nr:hypothetical protein [Spirochaetota bacterium]